MSAGTIEPSRPVPPRAARLAVAAFFVVSGFGFGSWFSRIPAVKDELGLSDGELGIALLGTAIGALLAMPSSGWLIGRWSSRRVVIVAGLIAAASFALPALMPSMLTLMLALALVGAGNGVLDVSMNAQAVAVEQRYRRPIMSSFHGIFSVGGLAGAAVAALAARIGLDPELHLGLVAAALLALAIVAIPHLLPAGVDAGSDGPSFATPSRPLAVLGVIAFCVLLSEGAVGDWSAVYLEDRLGTSASLAALGYTAFALTMAAGRLGGDRLTQRLGPVAIVRWGGVLVAIGLGIGLLIEHPAAAIFGFAAVGAGLAVAFPVLLSAAGETPGMSTGTAIAAVATAGYTGFLVGPPLIGIIAEVIGLRAGLVVVVLLGVAMVLLSGGVARAGGKLEQTDPHVAVPFGD